MKRSVLGIMALVLLAGAPPVAAAPAPPPPHPRILEAAQAPRAARIISRVPLAYAPSMSQVQRNRDFLDKIELAKRLLGVQRLVEIRKETLAMVPPGMEVSWEYLRWRHWPDGDRVGVTLSAPVWVPAGARKVQSFCAFEKKWQDVAQNPSRPSGYVWFSPNLADINNKARYRAETIQFETNSKFAPMLGLLLEYIFREGYYDQAKRLPLMDVRGAEDTYAVSARTAPVVAECLSFPDKESGSMEATVARRRYDNLAMIFHGHHAPVSNHRLGLAFDLNDFNYPGAVDGAPNPLSHSLRQFNRDAMHKLDARQTSQWVYQAAQTLGLRIPQEWTYEGGDTDWEHMDVGTK
ncbi:MAG: hypothetical protein WBQ36_07515 [Desulfobaccales bacterium]